MGHERADEREIDERGNHFGKAALDVAVRKDFNELFFELIIGQ